MGKERTGSGPNQREISLPKELEFLPLICQEGVRNIFARLSIMRRENLWLKTRIPEELELLLPEVARISQEIYTGLRPFKEGGMSWVAAREAARGAPRNVAPTATGAILNEVQKAARVAPWTAGVDAICAAAWETVKDQLGFKDRENPFLSHLSLYELGAAMISFRQVDERGEKEEKLVVDFPFSPRGRDKGLIACLVFGPDGDGSHDEKVFYVHRQTQDCSQIRPLKPNLRTIFNPRIIF